MWLLDHRDHLLLGVDLNREADMGTVETARAGDGHAAFDLDLILAVHQLAMGAGLKPFVF